MTVTLDQVAEDLTPALGRTIRYEAATVPGYLAHLRRRRMPMAQVAVQTVLHVGLRRGDAEPVTFDLGYHDIAGRPTVLTNSGWRVNFRGGHPFRATLAGEPVSAIGVLEEDPDVVADVYAGLIDELGWNKAGQRLGIKINVDRAPTHAELVTAVEAEGLSLLYLDGQDTDA